MTTQPPDEAVRTVLAELDRVLRGVPEEDLAAVLKLLQDEGRRWFCSGQGRSGLVAQMVAMRLMHLGVDTHAVGEVTAPSVGAGDVLMMFSGSGETPVSQHLARIAADAGATILAVTTRRDSSLGALADLVLEVPAMGSAQFGGSLFEQSALLAVDALVLALTEGAAGTYEQMHARHTNLQ